MRARVTLTPRSSPAPALLAAAAALLSGCTGCESGRDVPSGAAAPSASAAAEALPPAREVVHLVDELPGCDLEHRGLLFDTGAGALVGRFAWQGFVPTGIQPVEHNGATWARISERRIKLTFVLPSASPIFVSARAVGLASRYATVSLDDQPLGTLRFQRDQIRIPSTPTTSLPADPGLHTLTIRFSGRLRAGESFADVDWIRVGTPDDDPSTYGPPTLRDVVAPAAALAGVPHRSIALRAPGAVRCAFRPSRVTRLRTSVGVMGSSEGDAEIRVLRDGHEPLVLHRVHVEGGDKATWTDLDLPLAQFAGSLITLELRAEAATRGGLVLFGDPVLAGAPEPPPSVPAARAVVIVALNGVERPDLPPWSGRPEPNLATLSELASSATTFDHHRAPSTVVSAVAASLLTGLPPPAHTVTDAGARLPARMTTIGAIASDSSVRTGFFTGVPSTFGAFGFGPGWSRVLEHPPTSGDPATTPIDAAASWISETVRQDAGARLLAFVHARGGHPPWEVRPKELNALKPADYAGPIEPRRAAQILAKLRNRRRSVLSPDDRDRIRDLSNIALAGQDRAIGNLIGMLKAAGLWDETLFIVTGDLSSGRSDGALYAEGLDLQEPFLALPLYVHFPGDLYAGQRVAAPTEIIDVARTAVAALGLSFARKPLGKDLAAVASGLEGVERDPQVAALGDRYSTRWGNLVLSGRLGVPPFLCDLDVDPTCAFNRRDVMPLAAMALFRRTVALDLSVRAPSEQREPATIDTETAAVLNVWGAH
ncbi:sulfatase-like hydrolase/transferase [Sorangium sp. So ce1036]|uniref:sulfatase-like hydrolase/transferase n=1 Tax=Sorangium sp. So ce1036 TaxID=3133328 RepID=UPI003F1017A8